MAIALSQENSILTGKKMIVKSTLGEANNDIEVKCTTHKSWFLGMVSNSIFKEEKLITAMKDSAAIAIMYNTTTEIGRFSEKRECMAKVKDKVTTNNQQWVLYKSKKQ
jgi:hypothetical protein